MHTVFSYVLATLLSPVGAMVILLAVPLIPLARAAGSGAVFALSVSKEFLLALGIVWVAHWIFEYRRTEFTWGAVALSAAAWMIKDFEKLRAAQPQDSHRLILAQLLSKVAGFALAGVRLVGAGVA